jgi:FlaA1/EpsC-like NDP-sugar epimerase
MKYKLLSKVKIIFLILIDILLFLFSFYASIIIRTENFFYPNETQFQFILGTLISFIVLQYIFGVYKSITRFINLYFLKNLLLVFVLFFFTNILIYFFSQNIAFPRSIFFTHPIILFLLVLISRISISILFLYFIDLNKKKKGIIIFSDKEEISLVNKILNSQVDLEFVKIIDISENFVGRKINNLHIASLDKLSHILKTEQIFIGYLFDSKLDLEKKKNIYKIFENFNIRIKNYYNSKDNSHFKDLNYFYGKNIEINFNLIKKNFHKQVVLITGAGGSIGSELSVKILEQQPKKIILLDNSEYNLFTISKTISEILLKKNYETKIITSLVSILDQKKLKEIFIEHRPEKIFHSAAYKHVSLSERNHLSVLENNFFGTINLIKLAIEFKIGKFLLISTDKAVRPTTLMGITKRLAEVAIQVYGNYLQKNKKGTILCAVRFGNVLDSSGSVIPIFKNQIIKGGPVTVAHPNIRRYFMSIENSVKLILYSDLIAKNGEILILNMGMQHKILELAKKMIYLSALNLRNKKYPDGDIEIKFIGIPKNEKIKEDLLKNGTFAKSHNKDIFKAIEKYPSYSKFLKKYLLIKKYFYLRKTKHLYKVYNEII